MMRFVIICIVKPLYLPRRMDGIVPTIVGLFMSMLTLPWLVWMRAAQVTMSKPDNSFLPVLSRT